MTKLYYLRGVLGETHLLEEHEGAIRELLSGSYVSSDLEKLTGHEVYSFRTSQRARLLFSLREIAGQKHLVVLDYLPTHDYHKSRFLKAGVLKHYLEKHAEAYERSVREELVFEPLKEEQNTLLNAAVITPADEAIDYVPLDYYHQNIIELNLNQQDAIQVPLPAVISGVAGSGKSCVSLSILVSYLNAHCEEEDFSLVYVSKSRPLVQLIEAMWHELPLAQEYRSRIEFKTYEQLLPEEVHDQELQGEADFQAWYSQYAEHQKTIARTKRQETLELDAATVYQEFRIACAYDKETYSGLGERQSSLPQAQRNWLYEAYEHYKVFLSGKKQIDPALYAWDNDKTYSLVVVDEAQDLSHRQLIQLERFAKNRSIAYCLDTHQRLFDRRSVRPFLLQHLDVAKQSHIELNVTYRCPVKVVVAANKVIALKHRLAGGIADKYETTHLTASAQEKGLGHLYVLKPEQLEGHPWLLEQATQPHCAIVTAKEHIAEARERFKTPLVFTPEEIKGLEYPILIAYQLYEPALFQQAHRRLAELGEGKQPSPQYRPKAGAQDERFGPAFNQIYTAYTRAQQLLVLCEQEHRHYNLLLAPLSELADIEPPSDACLSLQEHYGNWEEQVQLQLDAGNEIIAHAIFTTKLGKTEDAFQKLLLRHRAPATPSPSSAQIIPTRTVAAAAEPEVRLAAAPNPAGRKKKAKETSSPSSPAVPLETSRVDRELASLLQNQVKKLRKKGQRSLGDEFKNFSHGLTKLLGTFESKYGHIPACKEILKLTSPEEAAKAIPVIPPQPSEKEAKHVLQLAERFIEPILKIVVQLYGEHIWLQSYAKSAEQPIIILAHSLIEEDKRKIFSACLLNNKEVIKKIPFEQLLFHFDRFQDSDLYVLLTELAAFKSYWEKLDPTSLELIHLAVINKDCAQIRRLHALGANLNQPILNGDTPAFIAADKQYHEVLCVLAELGANLEKANIDGFSPLCVAIQNGNLEIVKLLLGTNTELRKKISCPINKLLVLSQQYSSEVQERLILKIRSAGADSDVLYTQLSLLEMAEIMGHTQIIELLTQALSSSPAQCVGFFAPPPVDSSLRTTMEVQETLVETMKP